MSVASKNLFDLLGNDDGESETPKGPVKTVDKTTMRSTKRNVEPVAPVKPVTANTGARRGPGGNEGAFRDKNAGSFNNQRRGVDEPARGGSRGGRGARERGGRGGRFPRTQDDRHAKSHPTGGSEKQAAQGWGAQEGEAEQKDEQAGEAIAQSELKEANAEDAEDAAAAAEAEDKSVSYTEYLAQLAEKKLALGGDLEIRKPNEGSKVDKKWAGAKALVKDDDDFIAGGSGKTKRERERKEKQVIDIDQRYVEPREVRGGARGGRGGPRGGGRGDGARGRGDGARGGRGRGDAPRPARGGNANPSLNPSDESAFPSLGA